MAINQFSPPASSADALAKALNVASAVYGIKHASAASDLLNAQLSGQQQTQEQNKTTFDQSQEALADAKDPGSDASKFARANLSSYVSALQNSKLGKQNPGAYSALANLAKDPNQSAFTIKNNIEGSPLLKNDTSMANKDEGVAFLAASMANRNANTQEKTDLNANKQYQTTMAPLEGTILQANKVQNIIQKIEKADPSDPNSIKSTKLLRAELTNALGSMLNQGKAATVHGSSDANQDTIMGSINDAYTKVTGDPTNTIPPALLQQIYNDAGGVREAAANNHAVQYGSMREGLPDRVRVASDNRFNKFRQLAGLDANTPGTTSAADSQAAASQSAATNAPPPGVPSKSDIMAELARRAQASK